MNPPVESTAIPLKAAPLVQPLAIWAPIPNKIPPLNAKIKRRLFVILGECCTLQPILPAKPPEIKAPISTPIVSKTIQLFIGDLSP